MPRLLVLVCSLVLTTAMTATTAAQEVRLAVTDLVGLEELQREFGAFVAELESASGHTIRFVPVTNRTAAAEALRFRQVDFVLTGPAEYVVMRQRTGAIPVVGFSRPDYYSMIICMADSGMQTPADLNGRRVAMGSVGSTSKHLGPMQIMADYGLDPLQQVEVVNTRYPVAWESLKRGDVHAIGITADKFHKLRDQEAEAGGLQPGAFKVLGRGPDLPNDVLLAGTHVDAALVETMRNAFTSRSEQLIAAILQGDDNQKYRGMQFLASIDDEDYNYVRSMYRTIGYPEFAEFVGD